MSDQNEVLRTKTITPPSAATPFNRASEARPASMDPEPDAVQPVQVPKTISTPDSPPPSFGDDWQAVGLPSAGLAGYNPTIFVRRFGLADLARLSAARAQESITLLSLAIGATLSMPVSLMTTDDFHFILYWHRKNSYLQMPWNVKWRSRYNKENVTDVKQTTLSITTLEHSDEIKSFLDEGFDFPRVQAQVWDESLETPLTQEQRSVFNMALLYKGDAKADDIAGRMEELNAKTDLSVYEKLHRWSQLSSHGVRESVKLACKHFDPHTAISDLSDTLEIIQSVTDTVTYDDSVAAEVSSIVREIASLKKLEAEGKLDEAVAVSEDIAIPLNVHMFFPYDI